MLDATALLAFCLEEPGADAVAAALEQPDVAMTAANLAESTSKLRQRGWALGEVEALIRALQIAVVREDEALALVAGELHARHRGRGLALGDALCLAAALRDEATVLTADRAWASLDLDLDIRVIR